jgi:hypothetical protein
MGRPCPEGEYCGTIHCIVNAPDCRYPKPLKLCGGCGQPRSFHKSDECPHISPATGAIESWGPERWAAPICVDSQSTSS